MHHIWSITDFSLTLQSFNFSILQFFNSSIFQFFNSTSLPGTYSLSYWHLPWWLVRHSSRRRHLRWNPPACLWPGNNSPLRWHPPWWYLHQNYSRQSVWPWYCRNLSIRQHFCMPWCFLKEHTINNLFCSGIVFANYFISVICKLNGRKVVTRILNRLKKMKI